MSFPLSRYVIVGLVLATLWVAAHDVVLGGAYALAALAVTLSLVLLRVPRRFFYVMLFTALAIVVSHLLRPLILIPLPELFTYGGLGSVGPPLMLRALLKVALYSAMVLGGIWLGFRLIPAPPRARTEDEGGDEDEPVDASGEEGSLPVLIRGQVLVIALMGVLVLIRAYLQFRLGLFTKLAPPNPTAGFLAQFIPDLLIYGVGVLYLLKYRRWLSLPALGLVAVFVVGMVVMTLVSGSKGFLARLGVILFIYLLAEKGDFRLRPAPAALAVVVGAWALVFSFSVANPLRLYLGERGYSMEITRIILQGAREAVELHPETLVEQANAVTGRFNGFDGLLATEMYRPELLKKAFQPLGMGERIVGRLLPRVGFGEELGTGKAIGVVYSGHSLDVEHFGAVGMFGALELMVGEGASYLLALAIGLFWAAYFRFSEVFREEDLRLLLQLVGAMGIITWTMSGNFDVTVASFIIDVVHVAFYSTLVVVLTLPLQRRRLMDRSWEGSVA